MKGWMPGQSWARLYVMGQARPVKPGLVQRFKFWIWRLL